MKRLNYLVAILLIAISFNAFSQSFNELKTYQKNLNEAKNYVGKMAASDNDSKSEKTQALTWDGFLLTYAYGQGSLYSRTTPIAYDPVSNLVIIAGVKYMFNATGTDKIIGEIYYKQPTGSRWDSLKMFNEDGMGMTNPSISINNYNASTNMNGMAMTMLGRFATPTNENWFYSGLAYVFKDGTDLAPELSQYPEDNNPGNQYLWGPMKLTSNRDKELSYTAGTLVTPMETTVQYGAYGYLSTNLASQTAAYSKLPSEWELTQFLTSPAITSTYNAPMETAVDANNVYVAVNNIFADDEENRVPAVSKSSDGGATWSAFNRMPVSLLEDYRTATSFELIGSYQVYNQMFGFVAWGTNNYSYFFPVFLASQDTIREIHLLEAKCMGGTNWSLVKVAEINGFLPWVFYKSDLYPNATDRFRLDLAYLGYEIQASKTADGQYLVVKYIDQGLNQDGTGKVAQFTTPVPITTLNANNEEVDATLGEISISDIYIARRNINSNNWNVKNVTDDDRNYKATWIPNIVPAVDNIPVIWQANAVYADNNNPYNQLPEPLRDKVVEFPFFYTYSRITEPMDVEENPVNYNFKLFSVYPNPVTDFAEFTFQLNEATNVRIEITNSLGQLVKVVYNSFTSEGLQGVNSDLSDLSSGVYYYTLTAGNQKATKVMNILK